MDSNKLKQTDDGWRKHVPLIKKTGKYLLITAVVIGILTAAGFGIDYYLKEAEKTEKREKEQALIKDMDITQLVIDEETREGILGIEVEGYEIKGRITNRSASLGGKNFFLRLAAYDCPGYEMSEACIAIGKDIVRPYKTRIPPGEARDIDVKFHNSYIEGLLQSEVEYKPKGHLVWEIKIARLGTF